MNITIDSDICECGGLMVSKSVIVSYNPEKTEKRFVCLGCGREKNENQS